jgi:membrane protein DedA with SNARE-associated domain
VGIIYNKRLLVQEKYLVQSKDFFDKHGEKLLFLPGSYLYSELCSIVAGIVTMDKRNSCTTM